MICLGFNYKREIFFVWSLLNYLQTFAFSLQFIQICFSLTVLKAILYETLFNSWNQPVLSKECKASCSLKQQLAPGSQQSLDYSSMH
jgi:hypothetical protein